MSDTSPTAEGALARIVAAHRRQAVAARDRSPAMSAAWARSLRHAAVPFRGLELSPQRIEVAEHVALSAALEALPGHGMIAVLEEPDGARGILALSHGAIDALVEVQTTGRVDPRELPPRPVTRIDEALCRDFLDLCLAAFSREAAGVEDLDWPKRLSFGSRVDDRKQLNLLLPDRTYHMLDAAFDVGEGGPRQGQAVLILPRTRAPEAPPTARSGMPAEDWRETLEAALSQAPVPLEAILFRTTKRLRDVEAMAPGDTIEFDRADLLGVALGTPSGKTVLRGRLGQIGGLRAIRATDGAAAVPDHGGPGGFAGAVAAPGPQAALGLTPDAGARGRRAGAADGMGRAAGPAGRRCTGPRRAGSRRGRAGPAGDGGDATDADADGHADTDADGAGRAARFHADGRTARPRRLAGLGATSGACRARVRGHCIRARAAAVSGQVAMIGGGGRRMSAREFRTRVMSGAPLAGTFMKTPAVDVLEVLILGGLDFVCLDAEHAPFDRAALNVLCAVARAADFPVLVRVPSGSAEQIGMALDAGAHGIVVPHVTDAATAERVARAARFGPGGRGYAGSTRWAGLRHAQHAGDAGGAVRDAGDRPDRGPGGRGGG
jgi:flagellar motor switch protein FliM